MEKQTKDELIKNLENILVDLEATMIEFEQIIEDMKKVD